MKKRVPIGASLAYGLRLTLKHWTSLVPGSAAFYLPECLAALKLGFVGGEAGVTVYKFVVGCWLLWHALRLSDQETRASRLHEPVLPAAGYLGRFLASTLLFWGGLGALLWPVLRLASGSWRPDLGAMAWLERPWDWSGPERRLALESLFLAAPACLWSVYGWFHGYYVADEGQGAWQSMTSSFHAVGNAFWRCSWFLLTIAAINALGLSLWVVGIFFAFPVTLMATTYVHLELKHQS